MAAVMPGEISRRPAEPGADIEHPLGPGEADELGEAHRRRPLATVKLIDRGQVVRCQVINILSGCFERREDRLAEILAGVMGLDRNVRPRLPQLV